MAAFGRAVARALFLFAPLLVAALSSGIVLRNDWLRALARPIDGGATLRGKRVLGEGKTWRIVAVTVVACIATVAAQRAFADRLGWLAVVDYADASPLALGAALGLGAMLGELPNSFVKRRLGIARGETARTPFRRVVFYVWDQVDLLTTTWPMILPWVKPDGLLVATSFALALSIHPLVAVMGYAIGARRSRR